MREIVRTRLAKDLGKYREAMISLIAGLLSVSSFCLSGAALAQSVPTDDLPGWDLTFTDDFNGDSLNETFWGRYSGPPTGPHSPLALWDPSHVVVQGGNLELQTYADPRFPGFWTSGGLALATLPQTFGKYLVRVRCEPAEGVACIGLLWPNDNNWPPEIDFFEDFGGDRQGTTASLHYDEDNKIIQRALEDIDTSEWHVLGVEWLPGTLNFTVDGRIWDTITHPGVPTVPMHLALQTQLFGDVGPSFTHRMQVDWVAVYAVGATAVPAPGSIGLMVAGVAALGLLRLGGRRSAFQVRKAL